MYNPEMPSSAETPSPAESPSHPTPSNLRTWVLSAGAVAALAWTMIVLRGAHDAGIGAPVLHRGGWVVLKLDTSTARS